MPPINLEKYRVGPPKTPTSGAVPVDISKYRKPTAAFKYEVEETPQDRANKLARYQAEAAVAEEEAKKANSVWGMTKNFGKAFARNIVGSEIGLGESIAQIIDAPRANDAYVEASQRNADTKVALIKKIREVEAAGQDASRLKRAYNAQVDSEAQSGIKPAELPTTAKVVGQIGGTALDLLTAGTYGKTKTAGMQSGKLFMPAPATAVTAVANHVNTAGQILKNETPEQLAKLGGEPELIKRTSINIVDGLRGEGMTKVADRVALIDPTKFATLAQYTDEVAKVLGNPAKVRAAITAISPELGAISTQKATGIFTKKGAGNILKGGTIGYGFDVTQGLQGARGEDRDEGKAFIPGMGTAVGVSLPLIAEGTKTAQNIFTKEGQKNNTITKRSNVLNTIERDNKVVRRALEGAKSKGVDAKKILSETDLLNGAVDSNGTVSTKLALENFDEVMAPFEGQVRNTIKEEGANISKDMLQKRLEQAVKDSKLQGAARTQLKNALNAEFGGFTDVADEAGIIPLELLHDRKIDVTSGKNYFNPDVDKLNKEIGRILKEVVEENTKNLDVKAYNKGLSERYAIRDVLEALNGRKVEGGRLRKHFSTVTGGIVGSYFGPLGTIGGAELGRAATGVQLRNSLGGNISDELDMTALTEALAAKTNRTSSAVEK